MNAAVHHVVYTRAAARERTAVQQVDGSACDIFQKILFGTVPRTNRSTPKKRYVHK